MPYPCERCNMDDGSPVCLGDKRCPKAASADRAFGPVRINGQLYTRPVIRVAVVTWGGSSCTVPVGELLAVIEEGGPYTVEIKTMALRDFEALPEFAGW